MGEALGALGSLASPRGGGVGADAAPDGVTILSAFGPLATKALGPGPDGRSAVLESYGPNKRFRCDSPRAAGLIGMADR